MFVRLWALLTTLSMLPGLLIGVIGIAGLPGFIAAIGTGVGLPAIILFRRKNGQEYDDKLGWERMSRAFDRYLELVKEVEQ